MNSLIGSAFRSFLVAFFGVLGVVVSLFVVVIALSSLVGAVNKIDELKYEPRVEPDAKGSIKILSETTPVILQVNIDGVIGLNQLTAKKMQNLLSASRVDALKDDRVKAVLLYVNSPGGTVFDSDSIYRALLDYKARYKVPVYAYVDGLCASGSFYIACAADKIYATDVSLIGSVGVISNYFNVTDVMAKIGVSAATLTSGKYKDDMNPFRPWKPEEEERHQAIIRYFYDRFVSIVTGARPMLKKATLIDDYGAQVFPAPLAHEHGYIDQTTASREEALKELANKAGLKEDYQVVSLHEEILLNNLLSPDNALFKGQIVHKIEGAQLELANKPLYYYIP